MKTHKTQVQKKIYNLILIIAALVWTTALLNSCSKENQSPITSVYIAGNTQDGVNTIPCYWKDSNLTTLSTDDIDNGSARAIQVVDNTVYTAGYRFYPNDEDDPATVFVPCYWKGRTREDLEDISGLSGIGKAEDIQVVGDYVFVAGFTTSNDGNAKPCYWFRSKDDEGHADLSLIGGYIAGEARALHIEGNTIYTAGYIQNESGVQAPCYWGNETRYDLQLDEDENGFAEDIYVVGTDVYVAGYTEDAVGFITPCYWTTNGERTDMPLYEFSEDAVALAIQVKENTVYATGFGNIIDPPDTETDLFPFYWVDEIDNINPPAIGLLPVIHPVPAVPEEPEGSAYAIDITENAVYISGYSRNNAGAAVPCYWENGARTDLPALSLDHDGKAYGIYVVEE